MNNIIIGEFLSFTATHGNTVVYFQRKKKYFARAKIRSTINFSTLLKQSIIKLTLVGETSVLTQHNRRIHLFTVQKLHTDFFHLATLMVSFAVNSFFTDVFILDASNLINLTTRTHFFCLFLHKIMLKISQFWIVERTLRAYCPSVSGKKTFSKVIIKKISSIWNYNPVSKKLSVDVAPKCEIILRYFDLTSDVTSGQSVNILVLQIFRFNDRAQEDPQI